MATLVAGGCAEIEDAHYGEIASAATVSSHVSSGCSTAVVLGLSKQIADELSCMSPSSLTSFSPGGNIVFSSNAVLPYVTPAAKTALAKVSGSVQINSGFRTVAQQYLLYKWYQQRRCGITAAASPGRSNHQSGRASDISNYSSRKTALRSAGWAQTVPGDPVHFDHGASPDHRGKDVMAFQRLWNRNNPNDKISEDGSYGPQTENALRMAPATGFAKGATCARRSVGADILSMIGPDRVAPGAHATYTIVIENTSEVDWPSTTRLMVAGGEASELYDSSSWTSPSEVGPINTVIPAGQRGTIDVEVVAPVVDEETPAFTQFVLSSDGEDKGTLSVAFTITPNGDEGESGENDDQHDEAPEVTGGCSTGGSPAGLALLIPALALLRRRRR